jgi:hypothetical protein
MSGCKDMPPYPFSAERLFFIVGHFDERYDDVLIYNAISCTPDAFGKFPLPFVFSATYP